jgi:hypothetical protein
MSFKNTSITFFLFLCCISLGFLLSVNLCDAQYLPYNYGNPYGTYGTYGSGVGTSNIPIITPFSRTYIDSISYYNPYGYGTNSSSPYTMGGLYGLYGGLYGGPYGLYGGGAYGGFYGLYGGGLYGGFYGPYGGIYGLGNFAGLGFLNIPYGLGGFGGPWFF